MPAAAERVVALDALRGLAVAGIVLMNVFVFAMPAAAYFNPRAWGGEGSAELAAWAVIFVLVEDKFRALFAMMFGAGVAILCEKAVAAPLRAHFARMAVLFMIGFLHALLLFSGDVLRLYAIAGLLLPVFLRLPVRWLLASAALLVALHLAVGGWVAWGWVEYWWRWAHLPGIDPAPLRPAEYAFGADPEGLRHTLDLGRESLAERVGRRLSSPFAALGTALAFLPVTLASMLVGIALWRNGLLAGRWHQQHSLRLAAVMAAIALPALVGLCWFAFYAEFHGAIIAANALVWSVPFDLLLGIGWAALAMAFFNAAGDHGRLVIRLAATGRLALSNYLGTSLVLGVIFAPWGFGLFGNVGRLATYAIAALPILLMLLLSPLWLAHFRQGPCEWLWRGLARGRFATLRR